MQNFHFRRRKKKKRYIGETSQQITEIHNLILASVVLNRNKVWIFSLSFLLLRSVPQRSSLLRREGQRLWLTITRTHLQKRQVPSTVTRLDGGRSELTKRWSANHPRHPEFFTGSSCVDQSYYSWFFIGPIRRAFLWTMEGVHYWVLTNLPTRKFSHSARSHDRNY